MRCPDCGGEMTKWRGMGVETMLCSFCIKIPIEAKNGDDE